MQNRSGEGVRYLQMLGHGWFAHCPQVDKTGPTLLQDNKKQ